MPGPFLPLYTTTCQSSVYLAQALLRSHLVLGLWFAEGEGTRVGRGSRETEPDGQVRSLILSSMCVLRWIWLYWNWVATLFLQVWVMYYKILLVYWLLRGQDVLFGLLCHKNFFWPDPFKLLLKVWSGWARAQWLARVIGALDSGPWWDIPLIAPLSSFQPRPRITGCQFISRDNIHLHLSFDLAQVCLL